MDRELLKKLMEAVCPIARKAGEAILAVAREGLDVQTKQDGTPLTRADLASHTTIMDGLSGIDPKFPILSEEGDLEQIGTQRWGTYWCVDPLDGTKEFVKNTGEYTVNIALVCDGRPILGVITLPATETTYYAAEGLGAWRCKHDAPAERIACNNCITPTSAVVSRSHLDPNTERFLAERSITNVVPKGSSLKICAVAEGAADIYPRFGPTCLWDTAAGTAIALQAGCRVVDLNGNELTYRPEEGIKKAGFIVLPESMSLE